MDLEILCQLLFESSELIFDRPKNSFARKIFRPFSYFHFCDPKLKVETFVVIPTCREKSTLQNGLFDFILSFDKASDFSFFLNRDF